MGDFCCPVSPVPLESASVARCGPNRAFDLSNSVREDLVTRQERAPRYRWHLCDGPSRWSHSGRKLRFSTHVDPSSAPSGFAFAADSGGAAGYRPRVRVYDTLSPYRPKPAGPYIGNALNEVAPQQVGTLTCWLLYLRPSKDSANTGVRVWYIKTDIARGFRLHKRADRAFYASIFGRLKCRFNGRLTETSGPKPPNLHANPKSRMRSLYVGDPDTRVGETLSPARWWLGGWISTIIAQWCCRAVHNALHPSFPRRSMGSYRG